MTVPAAIRPRLEALAQEHGAEIQFHPTETTKLVESDLVADLRERGFDVKATFPRHPAPRMNRWGRRVIAVQTP